MEKQHPVHTRLMTPAEVEESNALGKFLKESGWFDLFKNDPCVQSGTLTIADPDMCKFSPVPFIIRPVEETEATVLRYRTKTTIGGKDYLLYTPGPQDETSELVKVNLNDC